VRRESGRFSTVAISMDSSHVLSFDSVTQYLVSFSFTDHSGSNPLTPTSMRVEVEGARVAVVPDDGVWLDNGAPFVVSSLLWEGVDVNDPVQYRVDSAAMLLVVHAR